MLALGDADAVADADAAAELSNLVSSRLAQSSQSNQSRKDILVLSRLA